MNFLNEKKAAFDLARTLWTDKYSYTRDLPDLGCRLQKYWSLRERNREQFLQTIAPCSKWCPISLDDQEALDSLTDLYKYLSSLKHPYLQTITEITCVSGKVSIIQPFFIRGSLRDRIFKDKPTADWSHKYASKGQSLPPDMIATLGKQILKAVRFLYDVGFPLLGQIHTGNIFMEVDEEGKEVCRLGGYENTLLGYRTLYYRKIFEGGHLNKIDVIMFGHVIYQMASGQVLVDVYPTEEDYERVKDIPEVLEVLHFIFETEWRGSHKKMLKKVENHVFFKSVHLTEFENSIKLTYPLKQLLDKIRKGNPAVTDQHITSSDRGGDLTRHNIKTFLKKEDFSASRAEDLGEYLGIKPGRIAALRQKSGGDPDRLLSRVIREWLNNDSEKSWLKLAKALKNCDHSLIAKKIPSSQEGSEDSKELDENERKAIFDEAMQFGHIDAGIIKILIVGAGGVGKSCLLRFLCDLPIPDTYNSTTLINAAQRVKCEKVRASDDSSDEIVWELVGPEKLMSVLADAIKSRAAKVQASEDDSSDETVGELVVPEKLKSVHANAIKSSATKASSPQVVISPSNVGSLQSSEPKFTQTSSESESTQTSSEPESAQTSSLESIGEVLGLLKYKGGKLFSVTWIYLVDSGGQPQFHELLTAFVRNATLGIFVFNLSEQLDDKPEIKYYRNGQPCGESYKFPLSHKEIFQHCVQTISSLCPIDHSLPSTASIATKEPPTASIATEEPTVTSSEFIKPEILVVGTHREEEGKSKESREEKEEKLREILQPYAAGVISNDGKYIFPIDSISRSDSDKDVRDKIRRKIVKAVEPFCKTALPLQYYALEVELTNKERGDVISYERCFKEIGPSLKFNQKTFLAAIQHLDRYNLILYFKSQAPDVIFTNPNTLLDKVGEIVEKSYIWRGKVPSIEVQCVPNESVLLVKRGEVTLEVLKSFESSYVEGLFDPITLTRILTHLFVLLPISKDKYFMPALLDVNEDLTSPTKDYLAVSFPNNAPTGLFSSSVVCLLSKYKWEGMNTPGHLFRNFLTFKVDIAQVTLLDKRTHFEVHIKIKICFKKVLPNLRVRIREDVINAVNEVKESRHLYNLEYFSECFCCPCSSSPPHLAKYKHSEFIGDFRLDCTKGGGSFPVEDWHKEWLAPSMEDVTIEKGESEPTKYRANTQLPQPSSSDHSPALPEGLIRRPQRSWQDRIPDAHLGNGSNEERETIREHEGHASSSPSEKPKEKYKFKDKRILYGFVVVMIILAGVATGFLYKYATTGSSVQEEPSAGPNTQPIWEESSAGPSTTPTDPRKIKQFKGHRIKNLKDLISSTEEFGDWYGLCLSLKVEQAVMNQLDDSTERPVQKMRRCLMNYFNNRIPLWDDVVRAIAELHNKRLACRIATEHMQWEEKDCKVELNM